MLNSADVFAQEFFSTKQQKNVWVAYSGGVDSHVLLMLAKEYFHKVSAIHINHKVSSLDDAWEYHCRNICRQHNIDLIVKDVVLNIPRGKSIEEAARIARREEWSKLFSNQDILLLAHHAEDQAETILFRLCRGTGVRGLIGMRSVSKQDGYTIVRPLLKFSKEDIVQYADSNKLHWIEDITNKRCKMDRNFIRNEIMPQLKERFGNVSQKLARTSNICEELIEEIEPIITSKLEKYVSADNVLDLQALHDLAVFWQTELIRSWLLRHDINPSKKHLQLIFKQVIHARNDANPQMRFKHKVLRRSQNKLYVVANNTTTETKQFKQNWNLNKKLTLPNGTILIAEEVFTGKVFSNNILDKPVEVVLGSIGQKAKKVFQQHGIPPWKRKEYPLVYIDNRLACIVGLWVSPRV